MNLVDSCATARSRRREAIYYLTLLENVRACTHCAAHLPFGPQPILQLHPEAKILIASQAPGRKVLDSGIPFSDASGRRLRAWLGVSPETFHQPCNFAILPMGFCFPGTGPAGDLPPRPECAPLWRERLLAELGQVQLTLVVGQYAQAYHYTEARVSLTERVKGWRRQWPNVIPLPHPSPRNMVWLRRNPWFESEVLPALRERVAEVLGD